MKYGAPQESCLGPLLFVIYASKLFEITERHQPMLMIHVYLRKRSPSMLTPALSRVRCY